MAMNSLIVWTRSMESNYTLNIYPSAQLDLDKIFAYIYKDLSNPKAAIDLIYAFREAFDNLRYFPESNPLVNNEYVKDKSLRKLLIKNYIASIVLEATKFKSLGFFMEWAIIKYSSSYCYTFFKHSIKVSKTVFLKTF